MKRSPLARSVKPLARKAMKRGKANRWIPGPVAKAFNAEMIGMTKVRAMGQCQHLDCGGPGTDSAHVFRIGTRVPGGRYNWAEWRNWPAARVWLCRAAHQALDDSTHPEHWSYTETALDEMEREAKKQRDIGVAYWDARATEVEKRRKARAA